MAETFQLSDGTTTISLLGVTGFVMAPGYSPIEVAPTGDGSIPPPVREEIPVRVIPDSDDNLATLMQSLAALQKRAAEYKMTQQQATPVWLTAQLTDETGQRRALVTAIGFAWRSEDLSLYDTYVEREEGRPGVLIVERAPYWERTATRTFPNATPAAAASVAYDYTATADLVGDVPARINGLGLRSGTVAASIKNVWLGIRSTVLHGATGVTGFIPVWELEDGSRGADVTIDAASEPNTASPGGGAGEFLTVAESAVDWDDTWNWVCGIEADAVGYATYSNAYGRFLWLLRAKVTSGTWEVYARVGYSTARNFMETVEISSTAWKYHELGVCEFPPRNLQGLATEIIPVSADGNLFIYLFARRTSGTGELDLDCLCPIPVDEGFLKIWDAGVTALDDAVFGQGPGEAHFVAYQSAGDIYDIVAYEVENFRLPPGDGRIICVYERTTGSVLTDQLEFADATDISNLYTERWTSLRGTE